MQSTTFRIVSSLTITLLLIALAGVIYLTLRSQPTTLALPTPRPTATVTPLSSATATPTPAATAQPTVLQEPALAPMSGLTVTSPAAPTVLNLLPAPSPTPVFSQSTARRAETDGRFVNGVAVAADTVWLATEGGALAWRGGAGAPNKTTSLDGLPGNRLTAVVACPLPGLGIVFGSDAGLAVFDAASGAWRQMNPDNSNMRFTDVSTLTCDLENQRLLIGYAAHGIDIFDAGDDLWRRLDRSSGLGANDVRALAVDNEQQAIWVVGADGVTRAAGQDSEFYAVGAPPLDTPQVAAVTVAPSGLVWLGGEDALYRVNSAGWTRFATDTTSDGQFPTALITGLAVAADGSVWLVDEDATVCRFSAIQNRCVEFYRRAPGMASGPVTGLMLDANRPLYTTAGNGHSLFDEGRWRTLAAPDRLRGNDVRGLAVDERGDLWVATTAGVQRFDEPQEPAQSFAATATRLDPATVQVLHPGAEGGMWLGGQGASLFDGDSWATFTVSDGLASASVQTIATDSQGRTWFGTDDGLSIWNGATFVNITTARGLPNADIRALAPAGDAMWIGSWGGGLYRFTDNQLEVFNVENTGLPTDRIAALAVMPAGDLLLGTERGLVRFADGAVTPVAAIGAPVTAIAVIDGVAWVATADDGVFVQHGDGWTKVALADGLPASTVTAIAATEDEIWLGGETGGLLAVER